VTIERVGRGCDEEDRLRRAAVTAASKQPQEAPDGGRRLRRAERTEHRTLWVEHQIRTRWRAASSTTCLVRASRSLGLDGTHDPDWWIKSLIQREQITVLPPALALRQEHAELDARLDKEADRAGGPRGRRRLQRADHRGAAAAARRTARS
jgi:hypothetical protein